MNASFEEKSTWIQLISIVVGLVLYFAVVGVMLSNNVRALPAYAAVFAIATVLIVIINVVGHAVAAIAGRPEGRDERDRLIEWRAESNSSWILGTGVILAIMFLVVSIDAVWVAHLLLLSLFVAEVTKLVIQLVYYRRGI